MELTNIVICAEEDTFLRSLVSKIEESGNFIISLVTKEPEELDIIYSEENISVVIIDLELTGTNTGLGIIDRITSGRKNIRPVILLPGEDDKVIYSAVCHGVYHYILKNQPVKNVAVRLEEAVKSSTPLASVLKNKISGSFANVGIAVNEYRLTDREKEILNLLIGGLTKRKIAETLSLSYHTVDSHLRNIYRKMGVQSRSQAITKALKGNLVPAV
jgi:DNA-binding NarL/FixJ family response regulator